MHIEVKGLNKSFGKFNASQNVSFAIEKGKLIGLLGPSGSGKTTVLRMIAGLEAPDTGDIIINGIRVNDIQAGAIENKEVAYRFLNIIDIETKRLYRLIQDILLLSEIENMDKQEYGDVKVASVIENCMSLLQEQADKKSVKIVFNEEQSLVIKNMSEDHLTQMMMNLLGNAVRYTDNGAIIITTQENSRQQIITIRDSGIGIPEESIPHIFERFYRVDKGRSRQSGGTGLGLSIVKHIAKLYEIKIEVSSELGEGTCFRLILNKEDE